MNVTLAPLDRDNTAWLKAVYPLYIYDLVAVSGGYQLDENGVWQPDYLGYWCDPAQPVLVHIIRADEQNVGFSLVGHGAFPYKNEDASYKISEFFLLRHLRRAGIARRAVACLLADRPGRWELEVLHENTVALAFWRSVLADAAELRETTTDVDTLIRFTH